MMKFTISRDDARYHAWPDVAMTPTGGLVCVFTECRHHGDRSDSRIMRVVSRDRGRTWSPKVPLSPMSQADWFFNNARISVLPDGRLTVLCDRVDSSVAREHGLKTCMYKWTADPEGEHWSEPELLPFWGIVPDKYRVLENGRHIVVAHNRGTSGKLEEYLWYSDDGGHTWSDRVTVAADPRYQLCEASVLELGGGLLVAFLRENSGTGCDCLKAVSRDWGSTWEGVYPAPIPACHRPVAGLLSDGETVLMTYRFMQGGRGWVGNWTQNVFAAFFSASDAPKRERWEQAVRIFPLDFDRSPVSDLGYTGWVQYADGEIYVVNYIVDDAPVGQIRGYSLRTSEVLLSNGN